MSDEAKMTIKATYRQATVMLEALRQYAAYAQTANNMRAVRDAADVAGLIDSHAQLSPAADEPEQMDAVDYAMQQEAAARVDPESGTGEIESSEATTETGGDADEDGASGDGEGEADSPDA